MMFYKKLKSHLYPIMHQFCVDVEKISYWNICIHADMMFTHLEIVPSFTHLEIVPSRGLFLKITKIACLK